MKGKLFVITMFATVDAFFGGFAIGFNSRHALIGDPSIPDPKVVEKKVTDTAPAPAPAAAPTAKPGEKPKAAGPAKKETSVAKAKPAASKSKKPKPAAKKPKAKPKKDS